MKALKIDSGLSNFTISEGFEILTIAEMWQIRGGNSEDKSKSKEVDVYDPKEN
jgi:hypothetical protein